MPRPKSLIDQLPEEAQLKIISWLECYSTRRVVEMIAEPDPKGFGLQTHITTLRRFYARHAAASQADEMEMAKALAGSEVSDPMGTATDESLKQWAFQIATQPPCLWPCLAGSTKPRNSTFRRNDLLWSARSSNSMLRAKALNHRNSLGEIVQDNSIDLQDKIRRAGERIFGKESVARVDAQEAERAFQLSQQRNGQTGHTSNGGSL